MRKPTRPEKRSGEPGKTRRPKAVKAPPAVKIPEKPKNMSLAALSAGMPGRTPACGQTLAEAAAVCLESRSHQTGVRLERAGLTTEHLNMEWPPVDDQSRRSHADMQE